MKLWKIGVLGIAAALFLNGCGKDCKDKIINPSMEDITAVSGDNQEFYQKYLHGDRYP